MYLFCHSQLFGTLEYKVNTNDKDLLHQINFNICFSSFLKKQWKNMTKNIYS